MWCLEQFVYDYIFHTCRLWETIHRRQQSCHPAYQPVFNPLWLCCSVYSISADRRESFCNPVAPNLLSVWATPNRSPCGGHLSLDGHHRWKQLMLSSSWEVKLSQQFGNSTFISEHVESHSPPLFMITMIMCLKIFMPTHSFKAAERTYSWCMCN